MTTERKRRPWRGISPEDRDAARRQALHEAGLELFGTLGWSGTSVEAIAKHAGVSLRHYYELFAGREALFLELYDRITAETLEAVRRAQAQTPLDLEQQLRAALRAAAESYADPRRARIVFMEIFGVSDAAHAHRHAAMARSAEVSAAGLAPLAEAGLIARRDYAVTSRALAAAFAELLVARTLQDDGEPSTDVIVEELTRLWLGAVA